MRARVIRGLSRLRPAAPVVMIGGLLAFCPFPTCLVRLAFGVPCPACGLTRASLSLLRLDLAAAVHFHPLAPALAALAVLTVALAFAADEARWRKLAAWITGGAGVALIVVWALRFVGLFGGPAPY